MLTSEAYKLVRAENFVTFSLPVQNIAYFSNSPASIFYNLRSVSDFKALPVCLAVCVLVKQVVYKFSRNSGTSRNFLLAWLGLCLMAGTHYRVHGAVNTAPWTRVSKMTTVCVHGSCSRSANTGTVYRAQWRNAILELFRRFCAKYSPTVDSCLAGR